MYDAEERGIFRLNNWRYKKNRYPMCIGGISCLPNVTDIGQCNLDRPYKCHHGHVIGVTCRLKPVNIPDVPVRLMIQGNDVQNLREGVVEVFLNDHWGFVLGIGQSEVNVLCKTLGFEYGGQSYKTEILQIFSCPENASHLKECSDMEWTECLSFGWDRWDFLSIRCLTYAEIYDTGVQLRLAGLSTKHEGRVEILHNNKWGFIHGRWYGYPGANVLCKMIGYQYGGVPIYDKFIPGQGPLWIDYIECPLLTNDLQDCEFDWKSEEDKISIVYFDEEPAVVRCRTEPVEVSEVKFRLKAGQRGDILEYFKDGYWGYICGAYMGSSEASVFCHMLGFTNGGHIINNMDNGQYDCENDGRTDIAPTILEYMECPWNSVDLNQCSEREWSHKDQRIVCKHHQRDLRLKCRSKPFPDCEVQLFGGNSINEGQLLVKYDNKWATVHPDYFSTTNIAVVCRQLGFSNGTAIHIPFDSQEIPATANNIQQVYCPRGASHLGDCFYGRLSFKNNGLSPLPADCNEALRSLTYRGGV